VQAMPLLAGPPPLPLALPPVPPMLEPAVLADPPEPPEALPPEALPPLGGAGVLVPVPSSVDEQASGK
jgi:hypothetical protein